MKRVLSLTLSILLVVTLFSCANPVSDDLYYVAPTTENTPSDETPNTEGEDTTTSEPSNPATPIEETPEVPTVEDEPETETPSQDEPTNDNSTEEENTPSNETPEVSNEETPQPETEDTTSEDSPIMEEPTDTEDTAPVVETSTETEETPEVPQDDSNTTPTVSEETPIETVTEEIPQEEDESEPETPLIETSTEIPSTEVFTGYSNGSYSFKLSEEHLVLISDCNAVYNILDYQLQIYPHGANYDYYYYYLLERNGDMYGMTITVILDPDGNYVRNWDFYFVVNNPYGLVQNWVENKNIRKALMSGTKMTNFVRTYPYEN